MGKYSGLKNKLRKHEPPMDDWRAKVLRLKEEWKDKPKEEWNRLWLLANAEQHRLEEIEVKDQTARKQAAGELLAELFEKDRITSFRDEDGNLAYEEPTPVVKVLDPEALEKWVETNGFQHWYKIQFQTMAAEFKERALAGEEVPECVELSMYVKIKVKEGVKA